MMRKCWGSVVMWHGNSLGVLSGLVFVAIFMAMVVSVGQVSKAVHGPFGALPAGGNYELAGASGHSTPMR